MAVNLVSTNRFLPKLDSWKHFPNTNILPCDRVVRPSPPPHLSPSFFFWQSWRACCWHPKVKLLTLFIIIQYMHLFSLKLETTWAPDVNRGFFTLYSGRPSHTKLWWMLIHWYCILLKSVSPPVNLYITCSPYVTLICVLVMGIHILIWFDLIWYLSLLSTPPISYLPCADYYYFYWLINHNIRIKTSPWIHYISLAKFVIVLNMCKESFIKFFISEYVGSFQFSELKF